MSLIIIFIRIRYIGVIKMIQILTMATIIAPVTWGVVEAVKRATQLKKRYIPLMSLFIGVALGAVAFFLNADFIVRMWAGGISGLAATGLFELGKKTINDKE